MPLKKINSTKLEALGLGKARKACIVHATAAIKAKNRGDEAAFHKHCDLLDQCATIGRRLNLGPKAELQNTSEELINALP